MLGSREMGGNTLIDLCVFSLLTRRQAVATRAVPTHA